MSLLILANASPLLAKESDRIYELYVRLALRLKKLITPRKKKETSDEDVEKVEEVKG